MKSRKHVARRVLVLESCSLLHVLTPTGDLRSLQCPPYSCRNPVIPAESGGFRRNEIWQEGLLFLSFQCLIIPAEFGHSGIETGMLRGMRRNGMQRNPVVYLFSICLLIIRDMSQPSPVLLPPPPPLQRPCRRRCPQQQQRQRPQQQQQQQQERQQRQQHPQQHT